MVDGTGEVHADDCRRFVNASDLIDELFNEVPFRFFFAWFIFDFRVGVGARPKTLVNSV
jgi:hypothetical protein